MFCVFIINNCGKSEIFLYSLKKREREREGIIGLFVVSIEILVRMIILLLYV